MRIIFDHHIFTVQKYGGISRYFSEIINGMADCDGCDISLFMGFYIGGYGLESRRGKFKRFFGHKMPFLPGSRRLYLRANNFAFSRWAGSGNDIYHKTYYESPNQMVAKKTILTVHDLINEKYPEMFESQANRNFLAIKRKSIEEADGIIAISRATRNDLLEHYEIDEGKIQVIHHGLQSAIEPAPWPPAHFPDLRGGNFILYVGQRAGYKNFLRLLKVFSDLQMAETGFENLYLVCAGGGPFGSFEKKKIQELRLTDRVFYFDGGDDILAGAYSNSLAMVYPSLYEGFGLPPLEAMQYGCPVVCSNTGSLPEVVGNSALMFDPFSEKDLAEAILKICSDQKLRRDLVTRGYFRIKEFSWSKCARETLNFYQTLPGIPHDHH